MPWKKLLAWATGEIEEALRQKLEFVLEENRLLFQNSDEVKLPRGNSSSTALRFAVGVGSYRLGRFPQDPSTDYSALGDFFSDDIGSDTE